MLHHMLKSGSNKLSDAMSLWPLKSCFSTYLYPSSQTQSKMHFYIQSLKKIEWGGGGGGGVDRIGSLHKEVLNLIEHLPD